MMEAGPMLQAWRVVNPDFTSRGGFRWPFPGGEVELPTPNGGFTRGNPCPQFEGDGVCLAKTFKGAASGGMRAITGLVVEYDAADVLGEDDDKLRVKACRVVDVFDVQALVRAGFCRDLGGADLRGTYLRGADLGGTDLGGADLRGADLRGADLRGTYLRGADLGGTYLRGADLRGADLGGTYLRGTYLRGADLGGTYLRGADLGGADLRGADLGGTYLQGAYANEWTRWPAGFDAKKAGVR